MTEVVGLVCILTLWKKSCYGREDERVVTFETFYILFLCLNDKAWKVFKSWAAW